MVLELVVMKLFRPSKLSSNINEFDIGIIGNSFTEGAGYIYEKSFVSLINSKLENIRKSQIWRFYPTVLLFIMLKLIFYYPKVINLMKLLFF